MRRADPAQSKWFGAHVRTQGGVDKAAAHASAIGAQAFALFVKNQRQWRCPPLEASTRKAFQTETFERGGFEPRAILPHASYLINLGSPKIEAQHRSLQGLCEEMERCHALGLSQLNLHPGSSLGGMSEKACLKQIAAHVTEALQRVPEVDVILENTAGQGHWLGFKWEHFAEILSWIPSKEAERVGICFDSCHAFAAGYELDHESGWLHALESFDDLLGFHKLRAMHLNDSQGGCGSRLDRHASLGAGKLGLGFFHYIAQAPHFYFIPLILETPHQALWEQEISWLKAQSQAGAVLAPIFS